MKKIGKTGFYIGVLLLACLPLFSGKLWNVPNMPAWAEKVTMLSETFPKGFWEENKGTIESNLYDLIPVLGYRISGSIVLSFLLLVGSIQVICMGGMYLLLSIRFQEEWPIALGVSLFLLCPYRIALIYLQSDFGLAGVWSFAPWFFYGMLSIQKKQKHILGAFVSGAVSLALIGYGSSILFLLFFLLGFLYLIWGKRRNFFKKEERRVWLLCILTALFLWSPQGIRLGRYVFTGQLDWLGVPVELITSRGYAFSDFLTSWEFRPGRTGLGIGILLCSFLFLLKCYLGEKEMEKGERFFLIAGACFLLMATKYFPWEFLQRAGGFKLVSLLQTPGIFVGFAVFMLLLVVPGAVASEVWKEKKEWQQGSIYGILIGTGAATVYQYFLFFQSVMPL